MYTTIDGWEPQSPRKCIPPRPIVGGEGGSDYQVQKDEALLVGLGRNRGQKKRGDGEARIDHVKPKA